MAKLAWWWLALSGWVVASVCVHVFYIKRIRFTKEPTLAAVPIIDGTLLHSQLTGGLFRRSSGDMMQTGNRLALDSLADYLKAHPERTLYVTGYHTKAESQSTLVPNLGAVRAEAVRQYLLAAGVSEDQLSAHGRASEALPFVRDSTNALAFSFDETIITADYLARKQKFIDLFHPLELYFPTGSTEYIKTPDNERFVKEAADYLRSNPRDRLVLTGHTDSVGSELWNLRLSRMRASAVKEVFMKEGVPARPFQIIAKGESQPIAPNATPEGREANRRVTIVVEKK